MINERIDNVHIIPVGSDDSFIAAGDWVDAAKVDAMQRGREIHGGEQAAMSLMLRGGETNARKVFEEIRESVTRARKSLIARQALQNPEITE